MLPKRELYDKQNKYFTLENCPFCTKLNKSKILFESKYWFVMHNEYPYFDDKNWLMAIPKRHIEFTIDLKVNELVDFLSIEKFMKNYYKNLWEYFSFIRQSKSNKSVEHMHYHYLTWIPSAKVIDWEKYFKIKNWYKNGSNTSK